MKDKPIIFSKPMILALLAGRKTQTRRLAWRNVARGAHPDGALVYTDWNKVEPGLRLWVRERCRTYEPIDGRGEHIVRYHADGNEGLLPEQFGHWSSKPRPSIHMPRWASRLTLTVIAVKRERLQDISEEDAIAEGIRWDDDYEGYSSDHECRHFHASDPTRSFASLWCSLHGEDAWARNDSVIALTFSVALRNIDAKEAA